jgi:hypothetical protein
MDSDNSGQGTQAERLAQLADLHRQGVLSDEEFEASSARVVAGPSASVPTGARRPPRKGLGWIVAGSVAVLLFLGIGGMALSHRDAKGGTGSAGGDQPVDPKLAAAQRAVESFNSSNTVYTTQFLAIMSQGTVKCAVGFDVQFPDLVIFTETPLGSGWYRVALDQTGAVAGAVSEDASSNVGAPQYDPTDYVGCQLSPDGKLTLLSTTPLAGSATGGSAPSPVASTQASASAGLTPGTYVYVSGEGMPTDDFVLSPDSSYTLGPNLSGTCSGQGTQYVCTDLLCGLPCRPGLPVTVQPNGDLLIAGDEGPSGLQATYRLSTK